MGGDSKTGNVFIKADYVQHRNNVRNLHSTATPPPPTHTHTIKMETIKLLNIDELFVRMLERAD